MNKKYLSVVLFGALLAASAGTFTSCKDYDDDIKGLQEQIDKNGSTVGDLQTQLATLKAAAEAAQAAADAAKTAAAEAKTTADAAKAAGDTAAAEAAEALAKAKEAEAVAKAAEDKAIRAAIEKVTELQGLLQASIDGKVDQSVYDLAMEAVASQIKGIREDLNTLTLTTGQVAQNAADIKTAQEAIATLMAAYENLKLQSNVLQEYKDALDDISENKEAIETAQGDIDEAKGKIEDLWLELVGEDGESGLKGLIKGNADAITNLGTTTGQAIEALENRIDGELNDIRNDIKDNIKPAITAIQDKIRDEIQPELDQLHILVTARLTSISPAPDAYVGGIPAIKFSSLIYKGMKADENAKIPEAYDTSIGAPVVASYHFNPASFKLENAVYQYIDRTAELLGTRAAGEVAKSNWVEIDKDPVKNTPAGTVEFTLRRLDAHKTQAENGKVNTVSLQAAMTGDEAVDKGETNAVVRSTYQAVYDEILDADDVRIADNATLVEFGDEAHYAETFDACKKEEPRYKMVYNKVFNLKELVATCFGNEPENPTHIHRKFPIEDYKLSYRFAVASSKYNITTGSTTTEQQKWITCNDAEAGLYQADDFSKEAIGRTPILKVELVDANGNVVRRGFVKVEIGVTKKEDMPVPSTLKELTYNCKNTVATYEMDEDYIRTNLYRKIENSLGQVGMSHEEFWNLYDASSATATVTKNGVVYGMSTPKIVDGDTSAGVATKKIVWSFTHGELGMIGSTSTFVASITVKNKLASSEYPAAVTFQFTIDVKLPTFEEKLVKNDTYWTLAGTSADDFDVNVTVPTDNDEDPENCQFNQDLEAAYTEHTVTGLPKCVEDYYQIIETRSNGKATTIVLSGVKINGTVISLDKNDDAVKKALNSEGGLQAVVKHVYKLESGDELSQHSFVVNFIRPVNLNMPGEITLQDAKTGGDIANFQHNKLLTDWRGEAITSPYQVPVTGSVSYWDFKYTPKYEKVDGHYELEQEAKLEVVTKEVSFTATTPVTMYTASATYKCTGYNNEGGQLAEAGNETATFTAEAETKADADKAIRAQYLAYNWSVDADYTNVEQQGETKYTDRIILKGELVKYTYVADINYVPAKYKWVDGTWKEVKHVHSEWPNFDGTTDGQTAGCGCYVWTTYTETKPQWVAGNFWYFYGPFGEVTLDVTEATTNLPNGELPNGATLVQEGNTVKYVNVNSPVGSEYKIFIPATVTYGWGTATSQLTITVKPVKSN